MKHILYIACCLLMAAGCTKDDSKEKDMVKPEITDSDFPSPVNCQVYQRGTSIPFSYIFTDNEELGNFNIEIHNNFDHHSHSTSAGDCPLDPKKDPVNPWIYNQDYTIPSGSKLYDAELEIPIPKDVDEGDYHFMIRLTDKSGWQQLKAISIKIR